MVARTSLPLSPHLQILTPLQLFEWALKNFPNIDVKFLNTEKYKLLKEKLEERFNSAKPIPAKQKIHQITPLLNSVVKVKSFSPSDKSIQHCTVKNSRKQSLNRGK